jgi:hypothetical protein
MRGIATALLIGATLAGATHAAAMPNGNTTPPDGCLASDRHPGVSDAPAARHQLVPRGATEVALCRYRGLNPRPKDFGTLLRSRRIVAADAVASLRSQFDALPPPPVLPPGTGVSCPLDDGSEILAIFAYRHAADDPVRVALGGCGGVRNGHVSRVDPNGALTERLKSLIG